MNFVATQSSSKVILIFDFGGAVLLLWVAVHGHGHPCLGWVTVIGLVVAVMVGLVGVVGMSVVSLVLLCGQSCVLR